MGGNWAWEQLYDVAESVASLILSVTLTNLVEVVWAFGKTLLHREPVVRRNGFADGGMAWRQLTAGL